MLLSSFKSSKVMSPLDYIAQLNARVSELESQVCSLETANAILHSQLADGQEQAKRDSATIKRLTYEIHSFPVLQPAK